MRKVLSFVLVLSLVLGSISMAFAAPLTDVSGEKCEEAVNVLTELGVVEGYPDGSYKPEKVVTRAEMAVLVVSALGLEDYAIGTAKFKDMAGHWSNGYVAYAASLGIIAGYPDGTFKPDQIVTYDEVATMLVAALGYTPDSLVGTWPANYVTKAKTLGILDGIKSGATGANRGDVAIMVYQTLDQTIGKTNKDGDFVPTAGDSMMARLDAELYDPDGSVATFAPGDAFVLDNADAVADGVNVKNYIGAYVTAYANSKNEIIAIKEVKSTFLTGEFDAASFDGSDALQAGGEFDAGDDEYDVRSLGTVGVSYFLNGKDSTANATVNDGGANEAENGTYTIAVKISGVKIDAIYSVSEWNADQNKKVAASDLKAIDAKTPKLLTETFALDDNDEIDLTAFELVGVDSLDDIEKDNIVYVYSDPGASGDITKIEVGTEVVTGEVTKIKGTDFTVDGKVYQFVDRTVYGNAIATTPSVGDEIEAYLDANGDIFFYELVEGEADNYAIVLRTGNGTYGSGLNETAVEIELFLADGTTKVFTVDSDEYGVASDANGLDDAAVGYTPVIDTASVAGTATWLVVAGDVVKYSVNADGEIDEMEWVIDSSAASAAGVVDPTGDYVGAATKLTEKGYFDGLAVADDAVIFTFNAAGFTTDDDDYGVSAKANFLDTSIPEAWYVVENNKIVFMYVDSASTSADKVYGVLVDTATISNTAPKYEGEFLVDGEEVVYAIEENINTGHAKNVLYVLKFAAGGETLEQIDVVAASDYDNIAVISAAADVSGQVVTATININGAGAAAGTKITLDDEVVVYVMNADGTNFEAGTISDIDGEANVTLYDVDDDMVYDIALVL